MLQITVPHLHSQVDILGDQTFQLVFHSLIDGLNVTVDSMRSSWTV